MNPIDNVLQSAPKLMPKLDRVLPQINVPPSLNVNKSNKKTVIVIAIAIVVVVLIIVSAVLLLSGERREIIPTVKPTPTVTKTPKAILSPTPYIPSITPSPAPLAKCGNGALDSGESCDGTLFGGETCASLKGSNYEGVLSCTSKCLIDTTGCNLKNRIISVKSTTTPSTTQTGGSAPAANAVKLSDSVKFSNSVKVN